MCGMVSQNLIATEEKSKKYYGRKINPQNLKIGDSVFWLEGGELKKFGNQYTGPYEGLEILWKEHIKVSVKNKPKIPAYAEISFFFISSKENIN